MVPHLITALNGPINELEQRILESMPAIERWFRLEWMEHTPPFYSSVDVRNAGFKLAPVDTNLYPGGFNNLTPEMLPLAVQAAMAAIEKICPEAKNLLLIPEKHTRNTFYLMNVQRLVQIFGAAGLNVRLGTLDDSITEPTRLALPDGSELTLEPLLRSKRRLGLKDFDPCTILLNNDLSAGIPKVLEGLHEQYLLPPLHAGWAVRRKSQHFQAYEEVAKKFAKLLGMDPWLINPMFAKCGKVNFQDGTGQECVQSHADALLGKIRRKYKEYGIQEKPFVIVKADAGTYGMGIMTVRDAKDLDELNRKARNKMSVIKDGQEVSEVIIQEGVPTYERMNDAVAEPVVYMIDRYVVGGFYRVHAERGIDENLNSPGASFVPLAFAESHHLPRPGEKPGASAPNRFYMYGVIGRLAMLGASYELEATDPDAEVYE
ncbi:glutamate--cysteine ligase [Methylibium sp. Pch-M]|jgi:glutamate--cysteine ligase|uniref:Putative glutamate--cysteine ligase n=1 Tax=Methylibium petroleiphilum (strain ATCC BAA-1232 / LMG 22953 / PM1) TaxID=420662 RepID=A2SC46_METPP|nr:MULTISPECIES: glutamate--cysteine ligase [Methylibium]ABM93135.1 putative glutamate--cysteine ligase [Methylibium petroleiphilum PM1]EWS54876.1 glutamate--cysteine ligase [Methylibium sp. T29]EWS59666.1 glutamate--cysteine ligase [Methylibium sp. T29-B]MBN9205036.1 glutamate--cysteine ligase [Methylibium petroleiphilum]QAZ39729.1 glutamate--cysteine ligase [Methylibium sp. Pch-M]